MAAFDEARSQLVTAIASWDFSPAFPAGYTGAKAVLITIASPFDTIDNMLSEASNGQMTQPVIAIALADGISAPRALGNHSVGIAGSPPAGQSEFSIRKGLLFTIEVWADQMLGGAETVEKIAGQVDGCVFYNTTRLAAYRHLRCASAKPSYDDAIQAWCCTLHVEGDAVLSYFA